MNEMTKGKVIYRSDSRMIGVSRDSDIMLTSQFVDILRNTDSIFNKPVIYIILNKVRFVFDTRME